MPTSLSRRAAGAVRSSLDPALPLLVLVQILLLSAGWGGNAPALRFSLNYLPAFGAAGVRFLIGLCVILVFARLQGVSLRAGRREWAPLAGMGLLFAVQIGLLNLGSARTEAGRQALLINSYPLFVPVLAHLFLPADRLSRNKVLGTGLAFLGMLFLFGERFMAARGGLAGDVLITASAMLLAAKAVYTSMLVRNNHPYQVLFWQMVLAVPCFFAMSLVFEPQRYAWSPPVLASMLYQGVVVGGLCFVGWTRLLQHYQPGRLSVGFFMTPVFGAVFSHWLLGEPVTGGLFAAGAVIVTGLVLVNR